MNRLLDSSRSAAFLEDFLAFERRIAWYAMLLSQTLLKLTVPGVAEVYQGAELWDFSMVDPDNRRPVDFAHREKLLTKLRQQGGSERPDPAFLRELLHDWRNGRVKMFLVSRLLRLRRTRPGLFQRGDYLPLEVTGGKAHHLCAFARVHGDAALVVMAPRFFTGLSPETVPPVGRLWETTTVSCPPGWEKRCWYGVLDGAIVRPKTAGDPPVLCAGTGLAEFPVAAFLTA